MTQPNAFAAAAQAASAGAQQSAPQSNPLPFNTDNPFGAPSEFKGGSFTPTPPMEALQGRSCIFVPRTFDPAAPDPFNPGNTRKQWTADLYVLDGGELRFWYKQKADPNANPPRPAADVEQVVPEVTPTNPYVSLGCWVSQAAIVPKLTGVSEKRQFLACTITRGAQKADRDKGVTDQAVRDAHAAWVSRGKSGPEPKSLWLAEDLTPEQMQRAVEWWNAAKDTIKL